MQNVNRQAYIYKPKFGLFIIKTMKCKRPKRDIVLSFISEKKKEIIKEYIVTFHLDENLTNPLGCVRIDSEIQKCFGLINNETYDIYLKLKNSLSEDTFVRLLLAKLTTDDYIYEN